VLSKPSDIKIIFLSIITFGTYFFYWCIKSAAAVNHSAGQRLTPNNIYLFLPALSYWWMWNYAQALESTSYGRIKGSDIFLVAILAANLWPAFNFFPNSSGSNALIEYVGFIGISTIGGSILFCIVTQHKINKALDAAHKS
jgi:hypothetical protein